jgi:hypothetical protein
MAVQEFSFKFLMYNSSAVIDDVYLTVKQGIRTRKVELSRIKHFYVHVVPSTGIECIISFETPEGKKKKMRFNANVGDPGFSGFADAMAKTRPDADIRSMNEKEAHKLLGAVNVTQLALVIVLCVVTLVAAGIFMPALVHGFDSGSTEIDAAACRAACDTSSWNVTLMNGFLYGDNYLETYYEGENVPIDDYIAFVPEGWTESDPIYLLAKFPHLTDEEFYALGREKPVSGVLRTVLWEGIEADVKRDIKNECNLILAPEARLIEYQGDTKMPFITALIVTGLMLALTAGVILVGIVKNR